MTIKLRDSDGAIQYTKTSGSGTSGDPSIVHHILEGANGVPINAHSGAINTHHVDVHNYPVDHQAVRATGVASTLSVATAAGDHTIDIVSASGFSVGDLLSIESLHDAEVVSISANELTLDRKLESVSAIGATVVVFDDDMAVNGSISSPVIFTVPPPPSESWHIMRMMFTMTHSVEGDLSKFGGISALTNGIQFKLNNNGTKRNLSNWKTNGVIKKAIFDLDFTDKAGGAGIYGTSGRFSLSRIGVALKLDGSTSDLLEIHVQDDLRGLATLGFQTQGHITDQ